MNFIFLYKRVFMFESFQTSFIKSTDCFEILLLSINVIDLVSQNRFEMKYKKSITIRQLYWCKIQFNYLLLIKQNLFYSVIFRKCVCVCVTEREWGVMLNFLELHVVKENKIPKTNGKQQKANDKYNFFSEKKQFSKNEEKKMSTYVNVKALLASLIIF